MVFTVKGYFEVSWFRSPIFLLSLNQKVKEGEICLLKKYKIFYFLVSFSFCLNTRISYNSFARFKSKIKNIKKRRSEFYFLLFFNMKLQKRKEKIFICWNKIPERLYCFCFSSIIPKYYFFFLIIRIFLTFSFLSK